VNNSILHPISHHLQVTADYWSNFCFLQGYLSALVRGEGRTSMKSGTKKQIYCATVWCENISTTWNV